MVTLLNGRGNIIEKKFRLRTFFILQISRGVVLPETMRKLCLSTKFQDQEIR